MSAMPFEGVFNQPGSLCDPQAKPVGRAMKDIIPPEKHLEWYKMRNAFLKKANDLKKLGECPSWVDYIRVAEELFALAGLKFEVPMDIQGCCSCCSYDDKVKKYYCAVMRHLGLIPYVKPKERFRLSGLIKQMRYDAVYEALASNKKQKVPENPGVVVERVFKGEPDRIQMAKKIIADSIAAAEKAAAEIAAAEIAAAEKAAADKAAAEKAAAEKAAAEKAAAEKAAAEKAAAEKAAAEKAVDIEKAKKTMKKLQQKLSKFLSESEISGNFSGGDK